MKINDLLKAESITIDAGATTKEQAIEMMIDLHDAAGNLADKAVYTLSGMRVANPTRGLYIVGGRKVFVK